MLQLTYTSCKPGLSLNGSGGYTVRAASQGIDPYWLNRAPQLARYDTTSQRSNMARMAFQRQNGAAIVTHTVRTLDHDIRIASFMHAVIDPRDQVGAVDAISAWGSPFWKRSNDDSLPELSRVETLPICEEMRWSCFQRWLDRPHFAAMASFVLSAWLRRPEHPIVLLADTDAVAAVIWVLTHSLPSSLLRDLSFATHDNHPETVGLALVGYDPSTGNLPAAALSGRSWFNLETGAKSDTFTDPYPEFVVQQVTTGQADILDGFVAQCEGLNIETADELGLLYRVVHESYVCTKADLLSVQRRPVLQRWLLQDPRHSQVALHIIGESQTTGAQVDTDLVSVFCETPARVSALVDSLLDRATAAISVGANNVVLSCIDLCTQVVPDADLASLWRRLVTRLDCASLPIAARGWLAAHIRNLPGVADTQSALEPLLNCPAAALPALLSLSIDSATKVEACQIAINTYGTLSTAVIKVLLHQPGVVKRLLSTTPDPIAVASALATGDLVSLLDLVRSDTALQERISIDDVLCRVPGGIAVSATQLLNPELSRHWQTLIASSLGPQLISQAMNASLVHHSPAEVSRFLRMARDMNRLSNGSVKPVERRLHLADVLSDPTCPIGNVETIVATLKDLPEPDQRTLLQTLLPRLVAVLVNAPCEVFRKQLDAILDAATAAGAPTSAHVLWEIAAALCRNGRLLKDTQVSTTLVAYAFGATGTQLTKAVLDDESVDLGVELVALYARAGGPALNRALHEYASRWPEPAKSFCRLAARGRRINGRVRAFWARCRVSLKG